MRHIALAFFLFTSAAHATDCPENAKSCKVITLTPDEEQVMIQPRGILDTAAQARQLDLGNLAAYFRQKIDKAPAGVVDSIVMEKNGTVKTPPADAPKSEPVPVPTPDPRK